MNEIIIPAVKATGILCLILLFIAIIIFIKEYFTKTGYFKEIHPGTQRGTKQ